MDLGIGWREIPFKGELAELAVIGNGKDSTLRFTVVDGRAFAIALSCARTRVRCDRGILVTTEARGDLTLMVRYLPRPAYRMLLAFARVDYPGSEQEWADDCRLWERMSWAVWPPESSWAVVSAEVELIGASEP